MMSEPVSEHISKYFLTAGETNAQGLMPMTLIVARAIEVATEHANLLGIGYSALLQHGIGWVLARLSIEMTKYPRINEEYQFITWIESINRMYSDRCFLITDKEGNPLGHIRSMWLAIDINKRSAADLSVLELSKFPISSRICPIPKPRKLPPFTPSRTNEYTFKYTDIDFNRHVNTVQYVKLVLNQWSMHFFDSHRITHFDIAFHQECHYDDTVTIKVEEKDNKAQCEIAKSDDSRAVLSALTFSDSIDESQSV